MPMAVEALPHLLAANNIDCNRRAIPLNGSDFDWKFCVYYPAFLVSRERQAYVTRVRPPVHEYLRNVVWLSSH
jgi:hypothetical protein